MGALICLVFVAGLRDVVPPTLAMGFLPALPLPADYPGERDAALLVRAHDESGAPLAEVSVRVFVLLEDRAYFAQELRTGSEGEVRFAELPRAEAWILAYGPGRARAATRLFLDEGSSETEVVLRPAKRLEVLVVDDEERPMRGVPVLVHTADPIPHLAATDSNGGVVYDRLGPPPYLVSATSPGYEQVVRSGVFPGRAPLRIKLERLGGIEVTVIDTDGMPAEGATVLASGPGLWPMRSATTDAHGRVLISGLRAGVYDFKARHQSKVSRTEIAWPIARGAVEKLELSLEPGRMIKVLVSDGDVDPEGREPPVIPDASVVLVEDGLSSFPLYGRTDDDGEVLLGPISATSAAVSARAEGFVPKSAARIEPEDTEVRVPLLRGATILGEVVDDRDYPVDGASIEVIGVDLDGMPISETSAKIEFREGHFEVAMKWPVPLLQVGELGVMPGPIPDIPRLGASPMPQTGQGGDPWVTRDDGTFRAEPVSPGRMHVIVRHPDYVEKMSEALTLQPGAEATVRIVMGEGGRLEGRVLEEDRSPVAGARLELAAMRGSFERVAYANEDGTFAFAAVPAEVLLSVARPDAPSDVVVRMVVDVEPGERKELDVVLPELRQEVAIRVVDDRGYPIDSVEVHADSLDVDVPLRKTVFTDDDGAAVLPGARGVPLSLRLARPGKAPVVTIVERASAEQRFTMSEGVVVVGRVTGNEGRDRVADAVVTIHTGFGVVRVRSDEEGDFEAPDLPPGPVLLTARHEAYALAELSAEVPDDPSRPADLGAIDMPAAGLVSGLVVDPDEVPVAGARVAMGAVPSYLPLGALPPGVVTTDRDGRFLLGGLPEGAVDLEAFLPDLGRGWLEGVQVKAERTTEGLTITLSGEPVRTKVPPGGGSLAVTLGERHEGGGAVVVVYMVPPGGEAEIAGLMPGDRLLEVNGFAVRSLEEARRRLSGPLSEDVVVKAARLDQDGTAQTWRVRIRRERVRR